jgi:hypothetical protein
MEAIRDMRPSAPEAAVSTAAAAAGAVGSARKKATVVPIRFDSPNDAANASGGGSGVASDGTPVRKMICLPFHGWVSRHFTAIYLMLVAGAVAAALGMICAMLALYSGRAPSAVAAIFFVVGVAQTFSLCVHVGLASFQLEGEPRAEFDHSAAPERVRLTRGDGAPGPVDAVDMSGALEFDRELDEARLMRERNARAVFCISLDPIAQPFLSGFDFAAFLTAGVRALPQLDRPEALQPSIFGTHESFLPESEDNGATELQLLFRTSYARGCCLVRRVPGAVAAASPAGAVAMDEMKQPQETPPVEALLLSVVVAHARLRSESASSGSAFWMNVLRHYPVLCVKSGGDTSGGAKRHYLLLLRSLSTGGWTFQFRYLASFDDVCQLILPNVNFARVLQEQ